VAQSAGVVAAFPLQKRIASPQPVGWESEAHPDGRTFQREALQILSL
jgi:hypothetical protein